MLQPGLCKLVSEDSTYHSESWIGKRLCLQLVLTCWCFLINVELAIQGSLNGDLTEERDGWWISFKPQSQQFFHHHLQSRMCYSKGKGGINSYLTSFYYNPWSSVIRNLCNLPLVTVWCFLTFLTKTNNLIWAYRMPKNRQTFRTHTSTALHMKQPFIDARQYQISSQ